jgi:hypothetical protein
VWIGPPPCPVETWTNSSEVILPLVVGNQLVFDGMNDPGASGEAPGLRRGRDVVA